MKMRNIPLLLRHYAKTNQPPEGMVLGFAAYLLFMKGSKNESGTYSGQLNGKTYIIQDDYAAWFADKWKGEDADRLVDDVLSNKDLWGTDLSDLAGFADAIRNNLGFLMANGATEALDQLISNKSQA